MAYTCVVKGTKLIIEIDVGPAALQSAPPSKTGKTRLVASSGGYVGINNLPNVALSLNVTTK